MKAPNMETITKSLEKSLKNVSLSDGRRRRRSEKKEESNEHVPSQITETTLELNSHLSLPSHWEQCLDLKTGEIYYINWKNGMRVKEDPRKVMMKMNVDNNNNNNEYSSGESYGTLCSEEDSSYYDSEESSSESSPSSREYHKQEVQEEDDEEEVLVVAGCKACFMYFMVPKLVEDCPKCASQLLHFNQSSHYN
ncbi:unnamed protein product [Cochlearia groenlandica]